MQRWWSLSEIPAGWGRCVVTIGVFDGVHRGHQAIVAEAVATARSLDLPAVVVTFDPHPMEVVRPGTHPAMLTTLHHRGELLAELGVDAMCVLPFTLDFSRLEPDEFAHQVLVEALHAAAVVVGANFRFGHRAAGDVAALAEIGERFGFSAHGVTLLHEGDVRISSTYVRSCIAAGDVAAADRALGRPHRIEGVVVRGDRRGHELGYPTANVQPTPHAAVPADGIYAAFLACGDRRWPSAVSIGTNPTFDGTERRIEAFALDEDDLDLYGASVTLDFIGRIRDTERFDSAEALIAAIDADVVAARQLLAGA